VQILWDSNITKETEVEKESQLDANSIDFYIETIVICCDMRNDPIGDILFQLEDSAIASGTNPIIVGMTFTIDVKEMSQSAIQWVSLSPRSISLTENDHRTISQIKQPLSTPQELSPCL
jgi:hypothetical protein